jgi:hypothetical protein
MDEAIEEGPGASRSRTATEDACVKPMLRLKVLKNFRKYVSGNGSVTQLNHQRMC